MSSSRENTRAHDVPLVSSEEFSINVGTDDQEDGIEEIPRINCLQQMTGGIVRWGMPTLAMIPEQQLLSTTTLIFPPSLLIASRFPWCIQ